MPRSEIGTTLHLGLSVRGALRKSNAALKREFSGCLTRDGKTLTDANEIRETFFDLLAEGHEFIPIGECDDFDPKSGCRGHRKETPDAP